MLMGNIQSLDIQIPHEIVQYWGWFLAFGIALLVLGVAAVVRSVTATILSMLFFGWLLLLSSGIEIAQAVMVGHWAGFFQHLVAAILFGVVGVIMVTRPLISAEVMTVFMATFFLIGGLFQLIASLAVASPGWGWHVADGIITAILGVLGSGAMAGLRALGHRPVCRYRLDFLRRRVDRAGAGLARQLKQRCCAIATKGARRRLISTARVCPFWLLSRSPGNMEGLLH